MKWKVLVILWICKITDCVLDLTLVLQTPIVAYNEEVVMKCVGSNTLFHPLSFPFKVEADIGRGTNLTHQRVYGRIEPESWPGRQVKIFESVLAEKFGIFSCTGRDASSGETTKASGVIMSKNALIFPTSLSYRASINELITLNMIQAQRMPIDELVWYHLLNYASPRRLAVGQLQLNIQSAKKEDSGPYLIFFPVNNPIRRVLLQALTRVVVRNCIADMFGENCDQVCPSCENGGICDDVSGNCICPPGFMGELCQIGCGPNKFGRRCQYLCSEDPGADQDAGCKGKMFCLADPYGCSCSTGFSGIICTLECPKAKYGEGCMHDCHCQSDECNPYTGVCLHGCSEGWTGSNCQQPCPDNYFGINCNRTCGFCANNGVCDIFTGHCPLFNEDSSNTEEYVTVCQFSYLPPFCIEKCRNGTWGEDCRNNCHCRNNTACDVATGSCEESKDNTAGITCNRERISRRLPLTQRPAKLLGLRLVAATVLGIEPESWPGRQVKIFESVLAEKFGIFSCTGRDASSGETTKASGVIMSKNALIFPTSLSYRASINELITLNMIQAQRMPIDELVWYHLLNYASPRRLAVGQLQLNIQSAKREDSGPYLIFFPVNNPIRRVLLQALTRVVVRNCIADMFGENCDQVCPSCENGGICDDVSGNCICPPGFMGELCQIGCGPNKFGRRCQYLCSEDPGADQDAGCKGKMFCLADPYGCSCSTGFSGIICTLECPKAKYGEGCMRDCHCQSDECNPYTGVCLHGCSEGWTGSNCQQPCPDNYFGINCNRTCGFCTNNGVCDIFTGHCPLFNEDSSYTEEYVTVCQFSYLPPFCIEKCRNGTWGEDCRNNCHCRNNTACDVATGSCEESKDNTAGITCEPGWQGGKCDEPCMPGNYGEKCLLECGNCINGSSCHHESGECIVNNGSCEKGFKAKMCVSFCDDGFFGENCLTPCNCANGTTCNPVTGKCSGYCQPGWTGISCWESCPTGTYGLNCSQECGNCLETDNGPVCDLAFGTCNAGCRRAWTGARCLNGVLCAQKPCLNGGSCEQSGDIYRCHCLVGYSGSHCEEIIPVCDSAPCNNNGTCIENSLNHTLFDCMCVANYTGDFCEVEPTPLETIDPDQDDFPLALILTCLFLFIILSSIFLIFKYRGKKKQLSISPTPLPEENSSETIETPIQELQEPEEPQKVETPEPQESINSEPETPTPETPKLETPKPETPKLEPPKPELPRTNTGIKFSDMSIPPSETIAHVTPMDHNTVSSSPDVSIEPESANVKKVSEFQNKISENFDDPFNSITPPQNKFGCGATTAPLWPNR
nr:multiple epidermal growth factor-like domains protein 11 [Ciona intestinalis]|eukprot:XP_026694180.1 multiple epidermal growth factor-like domains protein 11 [Ciona intestinalis]